MFSKINFRLHVEYLYRHNLNYIPTPTYIKNFIIKTLTVDSIAELKEIWPVDEIEILHRFRNGSYCLIGYIGNEPASYHWVQFSGYHNFKPAGKTINVQKNEYWIYHVRVSDKFKGMGIAPYVYAHILSEAKQNQIKQVFIYTSATNYANQRSLSKQNFIHSKTFYSIQVGERYFLIFRRNLQ